MISSDIKETFEELINEPDNRFRKFFDFYCNNIELKDSTSIEIYMRSGKEMLRMADVYLHEKDYLHAFVLYSRYIILYGEKIKTHRQYSSLNKVELAPIIKELRTTIFPRAEKLKAYIKELFRVEAQNHAQKLKEEQNKKPSNNTSNTSKTQEPSAPPFENTDVKNNDNNYVSYEYGSYSSLKNRHSLRNLVVPMNLSDEFLKIANNNTSKNIETCGILAGKLKKNVFVISHCIIPKQSGCSDTCTTEKEGELFDVIDKLDLITLGWIHTHPSQTAFLSSVDMHTHYSYQLMIPEAIAIVCAPKYNNTAIFILTPNFGMQQIGDCKQSGFHAHSTNPPLFEECDHTHLDSKAKINIIDLRNV